MEDLFRFVAVRPPQSADPRRAVSISATTDLQHRLGEVAGDMPAMIQIATNYIQGEFDGAGKPQFVSDLSTLHHAAKYDALEEQLRAKHPSGAGAVDDVVKNVFGMDAKALEADAGYHEDRGRVFDSLIAAFLSREGHRVPYTRLVRLARLFDLVRRVAIKDASLAAPDATLEALDRNVLLPPALFPIPRDRLKPVGIADLLVVKQHVTGYELGEIEAIENVLRGETRKRTTKHALATEQTTITEEEKTTETTDELAVTERFSLKNEAERTVKEDVQVKAGVSATYKYGDVLQVNANVEGSYSSSKSDTQKASFEHAKDVVTRAVSKVTERVRQQVTTKITESFDEEEEHGFDNVKGTGHISGVYQWLNQVSQAQVFNYGKRLLFDIMVPEPAALLIEAATTQGSAKLPKEPPEFTLDPSQLSQDITSPNYFGKFLTLYGVTGVAAAPKDTITVAKGLYATEKKQVAQATEVDIPLGYRAKKARVIGTYNYDRTPGNGVDVYVGPLKFELKEQIFTTTNEQDLFLEARKIPVSIEGYGTSDHAFNVEIECEPTLEAIAKWVLDVHGAIVVAARKARSDYEDALAEVDFKKPSVGPLGGDNPEQNRRTERVELKRASIALLSSNDLLSFDGLDVSSPPQTFPRPNPKRAREQGAFIRFFEQAFEWDQIQYFFYPYYWARSGVWYDRVQISHDDPLFEEFLRSGEARVVVPVRPKFEAAVWYFLITGQIWEGGEPPTISDPDYLSIADEIKEASGAPGTETPYGEPWQVRIPTRLVKLRKDDKLPSWSQPDPKKWEWQIDAP